MIGSWPLLSLGCESDKVAARVPGSGKFKALEDAPGSYVKTRIGAPTTKQVKVAPEAPASAKVTEAATATKQAKKAKPAEVSKPAMATKPAPAKKAKPAPAKAAETSTDDLTSISGIGPALARLLKGKGIRSYATLASMKPADIRTLLDLEGPKYRKYDPKNWPRQAKALLNGK